MMLDHAESSPVNGLEIRSLGTLAQAIADDPDQAKVGFNVTTRWAGGTRSETVVEGYVLGGRPIGRFHKIVADEPFELLGADTAPNPQELLMAAFNACITVGYVAGAAVHGIELDLLEVRTRGELDMRGFLGLSDDVAPGYEEIDFEVHIAGNGTAEQFEAIHRNVLKTSPNYFNISHPVRVNASLRVG